MTYVALIRRISVSLLSGVVSITVFISHAFRASSDVRRGEIWLV